MFIRGLGVAQLSQGPKVAAINVWSHMATDDLPQRTEKGEKNMVCFQLMDRWDRGLSDSYIQSLTRR